MIQRTINNYEKRNYTLSYVGRHIVRNPINIPYWFLLVLCKCKNVEDMIPFIRFHSMRTWIHTKTAEKKKKNPHSCLELMKYQLKMRRSILQCNVILKARSSENKCWHLVSHEEYPNLRRFAESVFFCYGSTHLCEYSYLFQTKSKYRSRLIDIQTEDGLRLLLLSSCTPDFMKLSNHMQVQTSH